MIDINKEQMIPVRRVPAYLESRGLGRRVHLSAVYRWIKSGSDGVRLESLRIGNYTVTSAEAIQRWAASRERAREEGLKGTPTAPRARRRRTAAQRYLKQHRLGAD